MSLSTLSASGTPCWWEPRIDSWVINLPAGIPGFNRDRICRFLLTTQEQRRRGLISGDIRDDLDKSIAALRKGKLVRAASPFGGVIFQDWARIRPDRLFSYQRSIGSGGYHERGI